MCFILSIKLVVELYHFNFRGDMGVFRGPLWVSNAYLDPNLAAYQSDQSTMCQQGQPLEPLLISICQFVPPSLALEFLRTANSLASFGLLATLLCHRILAGWLSIEANLCRFLLGKVHDRSKVQLWHTQRPKHPPFDRRKSTCLGKFLALGNFLSPHFSCVALQMTLLFPDQPKTHPKPSKCWSLQILRFHLHLGEYCQVWHPCAKLWQHASLWEQSKFIEWDFWPFQEAHAWFPFPCRSRYFHIWYFPLFLVFQHVVQEGYPRIRDSNLWQYK